MGENTEKTGSPEKANMSEGVKSHLLESTDDGQSEHTEEQHEHEKQWDRRAVRGRCGRVAGRRRTNRKQREEQQRRTAAEDSRFNVRNRDEDRPAIGAGAPSKEKRKEWGKTV